MGGGERPFFLKGFMNLPKGIFNILFLYYTLLSSRRSLCHSNFNLLKGSLSKYNIGHMDIKKIEKDGFYMEKTKSNMGNIALLSLRTSLKSYFSTYKSIHHSLGRITKEP